METPSSGEMCQPLPELWDWIEMIRVCLSECGWGSWRRTGIGWFCSPRKGWQGHTCRPARPIQAECWWLSHQQRQHCGSAGCHGPAFVRLRRPRTKAVGAFRLRILSANQERLSPPPHLKNSVIPFMRWDWSRRSCGTVCLPVPPLRNYSPDKLFGNDGQLQRQTVELPLLLMMMTSTLLSAGGK